MPLLTPRPKAPPLAKVSFGVAQELADEVEALKRRAHELGFDHAVDEALASAYAKIVRKLRAELAEAAG